MKIAMIGHKRIPGNEGGVETVVEELSKALLKQGNEICVYNRMQRKLKKIKEYEGIKIITIPTINKKNLDAAIYSFFASIHAIFSNYDLIHYHAIGPSVMLFIPHLFRKKTIATVHGLNWKSDKWGRFAKWYMKLGEKIIAKYADEIIVLSKNMQLYFVSEYNRKTIYLPNGVQIINQESLDLLKCYDIKNKYILYLGRIAPEKGLHYLIKAFKGMETDYQLIIAGSCDGSFTEQYKKELDKLANDAPNIIFTGFCNGKIKDALYSNCSLYVLPSDSEGMPLSLLEAMSCGCTCLASDIEECKEILKDFGSYFKKSNIEDLKSKLLYLTDSLCDVKLDNEMQFISENFSWDNIATKTCLLYRNIINKEQSL